MGKGHKWLLAVYNFLLNSLALAYEKRQNLMLISYDKD